MSKIVKHTTGIGTADINAWGHASVCACTDQGKVYGPQTGQYR
jgi:hypothetical protein